MNFPMMSAHACDEAYRNGSKIIIKALEAVGTAPLDAVFPLINIVDYKLAGQCELVELMDMHRILATGQQKTVSTIIDRNPLSSLRTLS
jgi:hypothetical protein